MLVVPFVVGRNPLYLVNVWSVHVLSVTYKICSKCDKIDIIFDTNYRVKPLEESSGELGHVHYKTSIYFCHSVFL